jgi:endonuclease YncB( thermonuclease family)
MYGCRVRLLAVLALILGPSCCWGGATAATSSWLGTVTHVTDGDTLWVQPVRGGAARKIRLDGVDAPEICQAFGETSRRLLAQHVLGQQVRVSGRRRDDYDRLLARVYRHEQDVGRWLVIQGLAWSHHYRRDTGPYARQEAQARAQRRGLFSQAAPERPRDFRQRHGNCH